MIIYQTDANSVRVLSHFGLYYTKSIYRQTNCNRTAEDGNISIAQNGALFVLSVLNNAKCSILQYCIKLEPSLILCLFIWKNESKKKACLPCIQETRAHLSVIKHNDL